jgi:adenylate cyclase
MTARILVVDDEPDMEALLVQKFRRQIVEGALELLFARDGVEALDILASKGVMDMVIADINMPRMESTIVVSAYGDMANIRTAMNRGAFDFLTKPIDFLDLEATISKTIGHVERLREAKRRQVAAERAYASLSRYFSPNLAQRLANESATMELAGQRREIASVFTDIAGFTALVEAIEPNVLGPLLNDYLSGMTDVVFEHDGTVAKIVGDALHVLFGAPGEQADHSTRAVACALDLDDYAEAFRGRCQEKGIALGITRIGVHAGPAIVGNFGGGRFFDYTAYGDTVNVAARLEGANKYFGTHVCASSAVAGKVDDFYGRPIGDLLLRGKTEAMRAFEPVRPDKFKSAATKSYLEAFAKLGSDDPGTMAAFAAHVGSYPEDQLASFHLRRLLNGEKGIRIALQ